MKTKAKMMMLAAVVAALIACSTDDPFDSFYGNGNSVSERTAPSGGDMMNGGSGSSTAGSGELLSYQVTIDKTSSEPTGNTSAYYPESTDDISKQTFSKQVTIDMANPVAKTENGVEITVEDGHITANHGSNEGICYVVSGTTTNGSLTIDVKTDVEVNLNNTDITNPSSTALDIESKMAAYLVLTGSNNWSDGAANEHKGTLYITGKRLGSGTGALDVYGT